MSTNRVRAVQERRRSNAAGAHVTRQTRAAILAQLLAEDPLEGIRLRQHITAVEEAGTEYPECEVHGIRRCTICLPRG